MYETDKRQTLPILMNEGDRATSLNVNVHELLHCLSGNISFVYRPIVRIPAREFRVFTVNILRKIQIIKLNKINFQEKDWYMAYKTVKGKGKGKVITLLWRLAYTIAISN